MTPPNPRHFYGERIPTQFNRVLERQESEARDERLLEDLRSVNATLKIVVEAEDGGVFFLNIREGRMACEGEAAHPPFLTLVHDRKAFEVLEREAGDSALGFLGGLSGLAGEMKLTKSRLENLAGLSGALRFELVGDDGFQLLTHFGEEPLPDEPHCCISVDADAYQQLRSGELQPQDAFMGGKIRVEGDMQMAMQLALAALSPD